jgi:hypothetical protein
MLDVEACCGGGEGDRGVGGPLFWPARGQLPVLLAVAAPSLTRLATALATLLSTLGPITVELIAGTLASAISLLALIPLALIPLALTSLPPALTLVLISLVVWHEHLLWRLGRHGD